MRGMPDESCNRKEDHPLDLAELESLVGECDCGDGARAELALDAVRGSCCAERAGGLVRLEVDGQPVHDARQLTGGGRKAQIQLGDKIYTLMITRAGKLILTK